jgi:hypothetical protein
VTQPGHECLTCPAFQVTPVASLWGRATLGGVVKFITRVRPGDRELQDRILAEAGRLSASGTQQPEAVSLLLEIAGDNPNAFNVNARGSNRTPEGQAVLRLVGTASMTRAESYRVGVPLTVGRHSTEEKALAEWAQALVERDT